MRFQDVDKIWTADLSQLSNADRGLVYFERAKIVIAKALADPSTRAHAINGSRFRRSYLAKGIGAQAAVIHQNPRIRQLLRTVDDRLRRETDE